MFNALTFKIVMMKIYLIKLDIIIKLLGLERCHIFSVTWMLKTVVLLI